MNVFSKLSFRLVRSLKRRRLVKSLCELSSKRLCNENLTKKKPLDSHRSYLANNYINALKNRQHEEISNNNKKASQTLFSSQLCLLLSLVQMTVSLLVCQFAVSRMRRLYFKFVAKSRDNTFHLVQKHGEGCKRRDKFFTCCCRGFFSFLIMMMI